MAGFFSRLTGRAPAPQTSAPAPAVAAAPKPAPAVRDAGIPLEEFFTQDHRACDELWAEVEASSARPEAFAQALRAFDARMRRHFAWEEDLLFPAIEKATGMHGMGPTEIMRQEHRQMKGLLDQMAGAEPQEVLDQGDTLMMLIQQHNSKEEMMLYPMGQEALWASWPELRGRLV